MPGNYPIGTSTNFPNGFANGLTVRGIPLLQSQPGLVFWLDNDGSLLPGQHAGSDGNRGTILDPFATLNTAVSRCQGGRGDIIMVSPGHQETISSATAALLATSDVAIIGLGGGTSRPQFTLDTAATSTINITGNNISFQNVQFVANVANIAAPFTLTNGSFTGNVTANSSVLNVTAVGSGTLSVGNTVTGTGLLTGTIVLAQLTGTPGGVGTYQLDTNYVSAIASTTITVATNGFALDGCEIRDTSAVLNFLNVVAVGTTSNACDSLSLTRNNIYLKAASGVVTLVQPTGTNDRWLIADNFYSSLTTNAGAVIPISSGKVLTNLQLLRNVFSLVNAAGTATGLLITTNGTTNSGMIDSNRSHALATSPLLVTASSGFIYGQSGSYHTHTADASGIVLPTATA